MDLKSFLKVYSCQPGDVNHLQHDLSKLDKLALQPATREGLPRRRLSHLCSCPNVVSPLSSFLLVYLNDIRQRVLCALTRPCGSPVVQERLYLSMPVKAGTPR